MSGVTYLVYEHPDEIDAVAVLVATTVDRLREPAARDRDPLRVGAELPTSGPLSSSAALSQSCLGRTLLDALCQCENRSSGAGGTELNA